MDDEITVIRVVIPGTNVVRINVSVPTSSGGSGVSLLPSTFQGRITTEQGVPVSSIDRTSQGTIYLTRYGGDHISLLVGSAWTDFTIPDPDPSLSLTVTSGKIYDVFSYANGTNPALELSAAWSDDHTPTDVIVLQDGISVKSSDHTRRWVGTIRASGSNITEDSQSNRFVWNAFNQVERNLARLDISTDHFYGSASYREWNGGTGGPHRVSFVTGDIQELKVSGWVEMGGNFLSYSDFALNETTVGGVASVGVSNNTRSRLSPSGSSPSALGFNQVIVLEFATGSSEFFFYQLYACIWG